MIDLLRSDAVTDAVTDAVADDVTDAGAATATAAAMGATSPPPELTLGPLPSSDAEVRAELLALLTLHDLWLAPIDGLGPRVAWQGHPLAATLKWQLEHRLERRLDHAIAGDPLLAGDPVRAMRVLGARPVPRMYDRIARAAPWPEVIRFLALETAADGALDGRFDDLVATCQVGLDGPARVVLGRSVWDELGRGETAATHRSLRRRVAEAVGLPSIPRHELPTARAPAGRARRAPGDEPPAPAEMLGALGVTVLHTGPRCRQVLRALNRLRAPADAFAYYELHAISGACHGRDWVDGAIVPLTTAHPDWGPKIVRGALWCALVDDEQFGATACGSVTAAPAAATVCA